MRYVLPGIIHDGGGHRFPVALTLLFLVVLCGCGKKTDPVMPTSFMPRAVSQFSAQRIGEGISLAWAMPANAGSVNRFRILRSELERGGAGCPGCPREYLLIDDLAPGARQLVRETGGTYRYSDFTVKPGRSYRYRVSACYGSGICSEALESAEIQWD